VREGLVPPAALSIAWGVSICMGLLSEAVGMVMGSTVD
jgi:hypothetical protein